MKRLALALVALVSVGCVESPSHPTQYATETFAIREPRPVQQPPAPSLEWEVVYLKSSVDGVPSESMGRMRVPDGWLVLLHSYSQPCHQVSLTFVPDQSGAWKP